MSRTRRDGDGENKGCIVQARNGALWEPGRYSMLARRFRFLSLLESRFLEFVLQSTCIDRSSEGYWSRNLGVIRFSQRSQSVKGANLLHN